MSTREVIGALPISILQFTDRVRHRRRQGVKSPITKDAARAFTLAARGLVVYDGV
jgi:hypothetical protein